MTTFLLPDLGEGLQEAELVAWHVAVGDHIVADQPLASVETDKAVVEIPAPQSGVVVRIHGEVGDILAIGAPLVDFAEGEIADSGTVVGELPETAKALVPGAGETPARPVAAAPAVRRRAKELGVDLKALRGSGPEGAISLSDVEKFAGKSDGETTPAETLRGVRRAMARRMSDAHAAVVPATVTDEADVSSWTPAEDVTLRLIRAIAKGATAEPALNAWYLDAQDARVLHTHVDLGIAMDSADGLFVPVLRDVARRSCEDLRRGIEAMKADVRSRTVPRSELRGQTITLSNFGMFGGRHAALVVMPPQVAILGAGRIYEAVRPGDGVPKLARVLPLSLTFDHRVVMGGEAAGFLAAVLKDLERES